MISPPKNNYTLLLACLCELKKDTLTTCFRYDFQRTHHTVVLDLYADTFDGKGCEHQTKSLQPLILKPCCSKKFNLKILLTNFVTIILSLHQKIL